MNINVHYEYFLLDNCPLNSFDIDSQLLTNQNNVKKTQSFMNLVGPFQIQELKNVIR